MPKSLTASNRNNVKYFPFTTSSDTDEEKEDENDPLYILPNQTKRKEKEKSAATMKKLKKSSTIIEEKKIETPSTMKSSKNKFTSSETCKNILSGKRKNTALELKPEIPHKKVKREPEDTESNSNRKIKSESGLQSFTSTSADKHIKTTKQKIAKRTSKSLTVHKNIKVEPCDIKPNFEQLSANTAKSVKAEIDCKPNVNDLNAVQTENIKQKKKTKKNQTTDSKVKPEKHLKNRLPKSEGDVKYEIKTESIHSKKEPKEENILKSNWKQYDMQLGENDWESTLLAEKSNLNIGIARNIINLFKNECTIPFIARYRRDKTGNMDADTLRHVKNSYEYIKTLETKALNVLKQIQKTGNLSEELEKAVRNVRSLDELEFIYAPFKPGSSISKAEKAKALGLEDTAKVVLNGSSMIVPEQFVDTEKEGLRNIEEVKQSIQNIIADIFSKDDTLLEYLRDLENQVQITIKSTKTKTSNDNKSTKKNTTKKKNPGNEDVLEKFGIYYDFQTSIRHIQPHQVLALNRGENLKILSVKLIVADWLAKKLYTFCEKKWLRWGYHYELRTEMFKNSFHDSYNRLICPLVVRRAKSELNRKAQHAAIESFAMNLKHLLQTPPLKGCSILGIDPGFRHGFKFALISNNGDVLWTNTFNFDTNSMTWSSNRKNMEIIRENMILHDCQLIAIGNGTGCRVIEEIISDCIKQDFFSPKLDVKYTIVNERGASIYSCTSLAKEEFPNLDTNLISAVFIARSLQDPLNEYVKVEPKHLGVGMYQHDVPEKQLNNTLDEIVSECVSFTGADLNTASVHLLKRISGLGITKASNIIEWRKKNGPFTNREQLTAVKNIGPKTYEQCSGFVRIHPQTAVRPNHSAPQTNKLQKSGINNDINPLDRTWIHPESYSTAYAFIDKCNTKLEELGTEDFIKKIKLQVDKEGFDKLSSDLNEAKETITYICNALMQPNDYDYRSQFAKPVFKQNLTLISSLQSGMILTGVVGNVTSFGAFVDIGVGKDGLIHCSHMNRCCVQVGDRVEVRIESVEIERGRISLFLLQVLK